MHLFPKVGRNKSREMEHDEASDDQNLPRLHQRNVQADRFRLSFPEVWSPGSDTLDSVTMILNLPIY